MPKTIQWASAFRQIAWRNAKAVRAADGLSEPM
jgi:hypothetical protein